MSRIKLRKFRTETGKLPGPVQLTIADGEKHDDATIWIEARFSLSAPSETGAAVVLHEALTRLQDIAQEAKDNLGSVHYI